MAGVSAVVLAACIFVVVSFAGAGDRVLIVSSFPQGQELMRTSLGQGSGFSLSFIHSVSGTPVEDIYRVDGDRIIQVEERFMTHGAGLPSHPNEPGGLTWRKDGDQFVLKMERPIPKLVVRTDKNYKNHMTIDRKTINLNQWEDQALLIRIITN